MKSLKFIPLAAAFIALLAACDNTDNRYIEVIDDTPVDTTKVTVPRVTLMEDFTGQNCVNCPNGHVMMTTLLNQYGERFIPVSIHCGGNTWSIPERLEEGGLRTEEGEQIANAQGIKSTTPFPSAIVGFRGTYNTDVNAWAQLVSDDQKLGGSVIDLKVNATLNDDKTMMDINVTIDPKEDYSGDLHLWVLESGIEAMQKFRDGEKEDYIHNHVFRGTVNGIPGTPVTLTKDNVETLHFTCPVKNLEEDDEFYGVYWDPDHLTIVGFIKNAQGVEQAAEFSF